MRTLTTHKLNGLNEALDITVLDEPGAGGACHCYAISHFEEGMGHRELTRIEFQNGPIQEAGVNGVSNEALLAIVIDRLESFQHGPFACEDNANALTAADVALQWLQRRTRERLARGVEGRSEA